MTVDVTKPLRIKDSNGQVAGKVDFVTYTNVGDILVSPSAGHERTLNAWYIFTPGKGRLLRSAGKAGGLTLENVPEPVRVVSYQRLLPIGVSSNTFASLDNLGSYYQGQRDLRALKISSVDNRVTDVEIVDVP